MNSSTTCYAAAWSDEAKLLLLCARFRRGLVSSAMQGGHAWLLKAYGFKNNPFVWDHNSALNCTQECSTVPSWVRTHMNNVLSILSCLLSNSLQLTCITDAWYATDCGICRKFAPKFGLMFWSTVHMMQGKGCTKKPASALETMTVRDIREYLSRQKGIRPRCFTVHQGAGTKVKQQNPRLRAHD